MSYEVNRADAEVLVYCGECYLRFSMFTSLSVGKCRVFRRCWHEQILSLLPRLVYCRCLTMGELI